MKLLKRNLQPIWYCLYRGKSEAHDDEGYETGEKSVSYEKPVKLMCNVSPATGEAQIALFGSLESYDKVIVTDDMNCPIDENTVLFIDKAPNFQGTPAYDYKVRRVAKSHNSISIAVSKVKVS